MNGKDGENMRGFHGIYPALLTPFTHEGKVNESALTQLVEMNLKKEVDGFYVCGSTGEAFMLEDEMRRHILEHVIDVNAGRAKIIAHIGTISQDRAVRLARHAEQAGADAVSSIPPFYYGFDFESIRQYYFAIADAVNIPVLIYNFPANTGVKLTLDNVSVFLKDPRFLGIKHTSSDFYMLEQMKAIREDVVIFNGYDEMFLSGLAAGADGGIGSTYNFMAEKFKKIEILFRQGEIKKAQEIQHQANNIIRALIQVGVMPGEKAILEKMGIPMGPCLKPFRALTDEEKGMLFQVAEKNGICFEKSTKQ